MGYGPVALIGSRIALRSRSHSSSTGPIRPDRSRHTDGTRSRRSRPAVASLRALEGRLPSSKSPPTREDLTAAFTRLEGPRVDGLAGAIGKDVLAAVGRRMHTLDLAVLAPGTTALDPGLSHHVSPAVRETIHQASGFPYHGIWIRCLHPGVSARYDSSTSISCSVM